MFEAFSQSLEKVAANWTTLSDENKPDYHPRLHAQYVYAGEQAMRETYELSDDSRISQLTDRQKGAIAHGAKVIMRYYDHAVASAARQEIPLPVAIDHLASNNGFDTLQQVAHQPNRIALRLEGFLCIAQDGVSSFEMPEDTVYKWDQGALTHPPLQDRIYVERFNYESSENIDIDPTKMCRAEKAHQLGPIAASLLVICTKDPQLFLNSYEQHSTTM